MDSETKLVARIAKGLSLAQLSANGRKDLENHGKTAHAQLRLGVGDDAAVIAPGRNRNLVLSCDAFLEDVHFLTGTAPADSVGYKALVRATSDLAAMGAVPGFYMLTLALPAHRTGKWLDQFLKGMARASRLLGIRLAGGDTSCAPKISISITVIGEIARGKAVERSGARPGDLVYVTGSLGKAQLGLELIQRGLGRSKRAKPLLQSHFYPTIQLRLAAWLAEHRVPSSMMDISDGLSTDLARLCAASRVGAKVWASHIPCPQLTLSQTRWVTSLKIDPLQLALHGGDDYQLLFTVPPKLRRHLRPAPNFSEITQIGELTKGAEISLIESTGRTHPLQSLGWDPFRARARKRSSSN